MANLTLHLLQIYFNSVEEAHEAAKRGHITSYVLIANNFTESVVDIRDNGRYAEDASFLGREIQIHLDMTGELRFNILHIFVLLKSSLSLFKINKSPSLWRENCGPVTKCFRRS